MVSNSLLFIVSQFRVLVVLVKIVTEILPIYFGEFNSYYWYTEFVFCAGGATIALRVLGSMLYLVLELCWYIFSFCKSSPNLPKEAKPIYPPDVSKSKKNVTVQS